jgi:hypothetical protein
MTRRSFLLLGVLLTLALPGCGRQQAAFEHQFDTKIEPGRYRRFNVDAPGKDQAFTVLVRTTGAPVTVYLALSGEAEVLEGVVAEGREPDRSAALAHAVVSDHATLTATVPQGQEFSLLIVNRGTKPAEVTVKMTGEAKKE